MSDSEALRGVVEDLVCILHQQTKELEKLVAHAEQVAGRLGCSPEFPMIASELSELLVRVKKLAAMPSRSFDE